METKIKCRKCGRVMGFWEFAPYIEVYLAKLAVETGLSAFILAALKSYFSTKQETRGFINEHMASFASMLKIKCPQCKKLDVWDPILEEAITTETKIEPTAKNTNKNEIL